MAMSPDLVALENRVDELARWLVFWTGLVVLGLLLEYGGAAGKAVGAKWNSKKFFHNLWAVLWPVLGGLLIVGGVAGELSIEFKASRAETELRIENGKAFSNLNTKSGDALGVARQAISEAAELVCRENALARQQERTATIQKNVMALQNKWNLDLMSHGRIGRQIDRSALPSLRNLPKARAIVLYKKGDGEAYLFSQDVVNALGKDGIGWEVSGPTPVEPPEGSPPFFSTRLSMKSPPKDPRELFPQLDPHKTHPQSRAALVMKLLRTVGVFPDPNLPEGCFKIVIGERFGYE